MLVTIWHLNLKNNCTDSKIILFPSCKDGILRITVPGTSVTKHKLNIKCEIFSSDRWLPCLNWRLGLHQQPHPSSVLPAPQACRRPCGPAHLSHPSKQQQHLQIHTSKNVPTPQHHLYHHGSTTVQGGGSLACPAKPDQSGGVGWVKLGGPAHQAE